MAAENDQGLAVVFAVAIDFDEHGEGFEIAF